MAKITHKKIESSTLIEVLIAMVVIMVVFSVAMGVFNNVLSSGISLKKLQAQAQMEVLVKASREEVLIESKTVNIDSVDYRLETKPSEIRGMVLLEVSASERGTPLGNIKCLIRANDGKATD